MIQTEVSEVLDNLSLLRVTLAAAQRAAEAETDAAHLRGLLSGAMAALNAADVLLVEAVSSARFLQVRKTHGLT